MNLRERFLEVMVNFNPDVSPPKWEFGYWGDTINNWYEEGLKKNKYPKIPRKVSTPTSSLYSPCWHSDPGGRLSDQSTPYIIGSSSDAAGHPDGVRIPVKTGSSIEKRLPAGIAVIGGGLYWPSQGFPIDNDVKDTLGMDKSQILVNVNLLFHPMFDLEILEEDDNYLTYIDIDGVKKMYIKETGVIPPGIDWVIKDKKSWEKLKEERFNLKDIRGRFPANWGELLKKYKNRDYPLVLGGYPHGYFGTLAQLMGYEHLFYNYYDDPGLIHDIQKTLTDVWIAVFSEVLSDTDIDMFIIWEDISAGSGSMVNPVAIKQYMLPYYKRLTGFLKENGVKVIFVDTDGDCFNIIPLFIEGGVTGMYPIEASCGMDLHKVRMTFPRLQLMGGIPKLEIRHGKERIDEILEPVEKVLKYGGYIPFGDHLVPPEVHWKDFKYYREKLNRMIDNVGK